MASAFIGLTNGDATAPVPAKTTGHVYLSKGQTDAEALVCRVDRDSRQPPHPLMQIRRTSAREGRELVVMGIATRCITAERVHSERV